MWLHDNYERSIFFQAADLIENHRREKQEAQHGNAAPGQRVVDQESSPADGHAGRVAEATKAVVEEHHETLEKLADTPVAGVITGPGIALTKVEMEAAMQKSLDARGAVKTREILVAVSGKGRFSQIDEAQWPALLAELQKPAVKA